MDSIGQLFNLSNKTVIITGGAGFLGSQHVEAVAQAGGNTVIVDINKQKANYLAEKISSKYDVKSIGLCKDITSEKEVLDALSIVLKSFGSVDILINNAAIDAKINKNNFVNNMKFESFSIEQWKKEIDVGLTGAMICSKIFGSEMADKKGGVILNISSDLGLISPDQRLYRNEKLSDINQPVKPATYSVIKHGLNGLTKYLATYWAKKNIRVNSFSPGGMYNNQNTEFLNRISKLIPLERMSKKDEYKGAILFLISDASSYMTGANLVVDGGRTCW